MPASTVGKAEPIRSDRVCDCELGRGASGEHAARAHLAPSTLSKRPDGAWGRFGRRRSRFEAAAGNAVEKPQYASENGA